jgi:16S rRNA (adenine1518-N6/adenine1519-N6)-dimethyltransferase
MSRVNAKKSLGQNFLKDETVIERILATAEIGPDDRVFEVGPGTGALTKKLTERTKQVVAVELDHDLVTRLQSHFENSQEVSILEGNILDINLEELLAANGYRWRGYKLVANIPYYITAPIIRTLLTLRTQPASLTLMVQKEVAERLTAPPGSMSLLSLMAQYYADAKLVFSVPPEAFEPVPAVESAVIHLVPYRVFDPEADRSLFRLARAGFAARRKTLANNLASSFHLDKAYVEKILIASGLRKDVRAQALGLLEWRRLQENISLHDI